jgi:hypothetical protein
MAPHKADACPLCGGNAVTLSVQSAQCRAYSCSPCRGIFIVSDDARIRHGRFDSTLCDAARAIFSSGGWAKIARSRAGVTVTRIPGSGEGRGPYYFDGQLARITGLSDLHNPNDIGNKAYLDWYDGWASIGRPYA